MVMMLCWLEKTSSEQMMELERGPRGLKAMLRKIDWNAPDLLQMILTIVDSGQG